MSGLLGFLVALAVLELALGSDEGTPCGKLPPGKSIAKSGKRRWYYCKTSGDASDGGCYIDADPIGDGILTLTRTSYDSQKQELIVKSFNVTDSDTPPGPNADQVDVAATTDEVTDQTCVLNINCRGSDPPFFLFVCRSKEGCASNEYQEFLDKEINRVKSLPGLEQVKTDMKNYYNPEVCKE